MSLNSFFENYSPVQVAISLSIILGFLILLFLFFKPKPRLIYPSSNQYSAYLSLLQLITDLSLVLTNKKSNVIALPEKLQKTKQELILYASPKIIQMFSDYIANIGTTKESLNPYIYFKNMNKLIKQIRKELGTDPKNLSNLEYIEFLTGIDLQTLKSYSK